MDYVAFFDELEKIASEAPQGSVTKDRALRALKSALLWGAGTGLGTGLGGLVAGKLSPTIQNLDPKTKAMIAVGAGGLAGSLAAARPLFLADTMRQSVYEPEGKEES